MHCFKITKTQTKNNQTKLDNALTLKYLTVVTANCFVLVVHFNRKYNLNRPDICQTKKSRKLVSQIVELGYVR